MSPRVWPAAATAATIVLAAPAWAREQIGTCGVCHSDRKMEFQDSAHAGIGMACVDCHGGDPTDMEITAMSAQKGFRGSPSRHSIPVFCARCHSDPTRMRQYGIPTNEFEDYQTSQHGIQWAKGNGDVPVCTDCHGVHHIVPVEDPRSSVYPANVPKTCSKCHSDQKLMGKYGLPSNAYAGFARSLHGKRLLAGDIRAVPSCVSCHGSHGATPPGVREIGNVCGQCHTKERDLVDASPHGAATQAGKMAECNSCHGHHYIPPPTSGMLETLCVKCHAVGSDASQVGQRMLSLIRDEERKVALAEQELNEMRREGQEVAGMEAMLRQAKMADVLTAQDQHSMDPDRVEQHTVLAGATGQEIIDQIAEIRKRVATRKIGLAIVLGFVLWNALLLYWKRRRVEERQAASHDSRASRSAAGPGR